MNDLVNLQINKEIISLYKFFLTILEDLKNKNNISEQDYLIYRKKILDLGNDCERNILAFISYFDFQINKEKVQSIANQKIVHRKVWTNSPFSIE